MTLSKKRIGEIEAMKDEDIDYSDIPETDEAFWAEAEFVEPDKTEQVTLRVKKSVLDYFRAGGRKGYQTRMNAVLERYVTLRQRRAERHGDG